MLPPRPVCASRSSSGRSFVRRCRCSSGRCRRTTFRRRNRVTGPPAHRLHAGFQCRCSASPPTARRTVSRMAQCAVYSRLKHCPLASCRVALSVLWRHCGRSAAGRAAVEAASALKEQIYAKDAQTLHTKLANIGFGSETETCGPKITLNAVAVAAKPFGRTQPKRHRPGRPVHSLRCAATTAWLV